MSFVYPVSQIFGTWYCYTMEILLHISGMYAGTIGLLVASSRYYFIVHHDPFDRNRGDKKITKFIILYIDIIFITSIVNSLSNGIMDDFFWENQCFGHKTELNIKEGGGFLDVIPNFLCYNREYQLKYYIGVNLSYYFESVLRFFCGISTLFCILILSNGIELVLYLITLKHMDR